MAVAWKNMQLKGPKVGKYSWFSIKKSSIQSQKDVERERKRSTSAAGIAKEIEFHVY